MSNVLRIKRRATGGTGAPTTLKNAELAFNEVDNVLYYGTGTDLNGDANTVISIGGSGAFTTLSGTQTISGNKTFSGTVALGSGASATTATQGDNSTAVATTAYVDTAVGAVSTTFDIDASDAANGIIALTLSSTQTRGLKTGKYYYDLEETADSVVTTLMFGDAVVSGG